MIEFGGNLAYTQSFYSCERDATEACADNEIRTHIHYREIGAWCARTRHRRLLLPAAGASINRHRLRQACRRASAFFGDSGEDASARRGEHSGFFNLPEHAEVAAFGGN